VISIEDLLLPEGRENIEEFGHDWYNREQSDENGQYQWVDRRFRDKSGNCRDLTREFL
jgi:hypothetical protein